MRRLRVLEGSASPEDLTLEGEILVGRGRDTDLTLFDETASRRHARIREEDGRTVLEDLDSANGVYLNGERIEGRAVLFHGDRIAIGGVLLRYLADDVPDRDTVVAGSDRVEASVDPEAADPVSGVAAEGARRRLRLLLEGAAVAADAATEREVVEGLLDLAEEAFQPDRATVVLGHGRGGEEVAAARPAGASPPTSRTLRRRVLEDGEAVLVRDAYDEGTRGPASMVASRHRSTLAAPLHTAEGPLGLVVLEAAAPDRWSAEDLNALAAAARQAALALRNLRLLGVARAEVRRLAAPRPPDGEVLVGRAPALQAVRERIAKAAVVDTPVLVTGETGTGKELVARQLHALGPRQGRPFVALNCAALVEGLLESEMFGHEKGAFTGALERRDGRIAQAQAGTLFLDEVGDLPVGLQAKLLRVLSEGAYTRVGGREALTMDCRLVAATNRDLVELVEAGSFRRDLYFRLAVLEISLPPLRARGDDVLLLAEVGLERVAGRMGRRVPRLDADAREALRAYPWPGNVRELLNALERAVVLLEGDTIGAADLPADVRSGRPRSPSSPPPSGEVLTLREAEERAVRAALEASGGRKGRAAEILGVSWPTLNRKIRLYGLEGRDGSAGG